MHVERGIPEELHDFIDFYLAHIEKVSICSYIHGERGEMDH